MMRIRGAGFNKEKFVCLLALLFLSFLALLLSLAQYYPSDLVVDGYAWFFGSAPPERLADNPPVTSIQAPNPYQEQAIPPLPSLAGLGDQIRKTPFAPSQYKIVRTPPGPVPDKVPINPPPPPALPTPKPPTTETKRPTAQKDKDLEVAYMGVMQVQGETYGLLQAKDGSYRRVKVGDKMEDFNYTITRIEKQAIFVQTEEGRVYMLKNDRFTDVAAEGGTGAASKDNLPSFAEPKKAAPAPAPHTPQARPQGRPQGRPGGRPQQPGKPPVRTQG